MRLSLGSLRDSLLAGLLGDTEQAEQARPALMLDMLSDWLPYRVYDPASRLYLNARSKGFVLGVSCGACEVMSPIVQSVATTWHIEVRAISTDGGPSRSFPRYSVETNRRAKMGLDPGVTPAVVLWDAAAGRAIPIGYGVMSADELQDRIYLLTSKEAGRDY